MSKIKKVFIVILLIVVIVVCNCLGLYTRYKNRLKITQITSNGCGYIFITKKNNLVIVDGGNKNNTEKLMDIISEHDNLVTAWIVTSPEEDKIGALCEIIRGVNDIRIHNLLNNLVFEDDWYDNLNISSDEIYKMKQNIDMIYNGRYRESLVQIGRRAQYSFDNFFFTPLELNDTNSKEISDQRIIYKVDNTFKNIILFNDINENMANIFLENDKDQFKNEAIFFYNSDSEIVRKIVEKTRVKKVFTSELIEGLNNKIIVSKDDEVFDEIW